MPQYSFNFKTSANDLGVVSLKQEYNLPFKVLLRSLKVRTLVNCDSRIHKARIKLLNSDSESLVDLPDESIVDCIEYILPTEEIKFDPGIYHVELNINGFSTNEDISVEGILKYGFGFIISNIDDLQELLD